MNSEIQKRFEKLAYARTKPFCYSCYREAPTGRCKICGSDDLMHLLPEYGCDYGVDWVIKSILESELTEVDVAQAFEDSICECYPEEVTVGWMTFDAVSVMKNMDPVSWQMAQSEWESQEVEDGNLISFNGGLSYYHQSEIECFLTREGV